MSFIDAIILGVIQGVTEPLPISSSGHLEILQTILNIADNDLTYEIYLNFGSLIAIVILYRKLLGRIFKHAYLYVKTKDHLYYSDFKYFYLVFFASIPAAIVGFFFNDAIESVFTSAKITGTMLIVTAGLLFIIRNFSGNRDIDDMKISDAIFIGVAQALALIPGLSRSGTTIVGGMFRDLKRTVAFDFAFLMYIPVSLGAFVSALGDFENNGNGFKYFVGMLVAGIFTYYFTKIFRSIVVNGKLIYFSIYCLIVGVFALVIL